MRQPIRKVDVNQPAIVAGLRRVGAHVTPIHTVGRGTPDVLCWFRGQWYVLEIKAPGCLDELTEDERKFRFNLGDEDAVGYVDTLDGALRWIGAI